MIIAAFTTWGPRLCNIPRFLDSLKNQTLPPDRIVCTLSREDFEYTPEVLIRPDVEIQWIDRDIKVWKKLAVVLDLYPGAEIVNVDDDVAYPPQFLATLHDMYVKTGQPVTPGDSYCGFGTLVTPEMFKGYRPTKDVMDNVYAADLWYAYILEMNGYRFVRVPSAFEGRVMVGSPEPYTRPENIKLAEEVGWINGYYGRVRFR